MPQLQCHDRIQIVPMKFIIVDQKNGRSASFSANGLLIGMTLLGVLGVPAAAGLWGYQAGLEHGGLTGDSLTKLRGAIDAQGEAVADATRDARENLTASSLRLAKLQAHIVRLDALGERLISVANLDGGEFNFRDAPAVGGPSAASEDTASVQATDYLSQLDSLGADIADRERQFAVLETLLADRKLAADVFLAGRPVRQGWMSSRYGKRNDPITGRPAWHQGVDFAAKEGSDVVAVAAGIVVYSGQRSGYGKMVEISHGGQFSTRYGHHKDLRVKVGDIVRKGQTVGTMGSSGRSTGPHVHFEVYKNGRVVDPSSYIHRASR